MIISEISVFEIKNKPVQVLFFFLFFSVFAYSQVKVEDSIQRYKEFKEVIIQESTQLKPQTTLKKEELTYIAPQDLGHLLQQVAGVTLRSYGGLGGMKTVALRGQGSGHTQLVLNGLPINNAQSSTTDLGLIQLDNLSEVEVSIGGINNALLPVSAQLHSSSISLTTSDYHFSKVPLSAQASLLIGSFGQYEGHVGTKKSSDKFYIGGNMKYRTVEGAYPYRIKMGTEIFNNTRRNNAFDEQFISFASGFKSTKDSTKWKHQGHLFGQYDHSDKELPGAVLLYNDLANQTLLTEQQKIGGNYSIYTPKSKIRLFSVYNNHFIHYRDPSYLNKEGFLDNQYRNNSITSGLNITRKFNQLHTTLATEYATYTLTSNRNDLGSPSRRTANSMLDFRFQLKKITLQGALFHQYFSDYNRALSNQKQQQTWNPQVGVFSTPNFSKKISFYLWYKESMRAPSFNELYYSQIGTLSLVPEEAKQINLGMIYTNTGQKSQLSVKLNTYANQVTNKILALPTKNLFVWSIQNMGKVDVKGVDMQLLLTHFFSSSTRITINSIFTHQHILDVTDEKSPTYRHQLAYTPRNTGNTSLSFFHKKWAIHSQFFYTGKRYSLNQNILVNEMDPIAIFDASCSYKLTFKKHQSLTLQAGIRNITNRDYAFIRYYVMPGRNYFVKLTYKFH